MGNIYFDMSNRFFKGTFKKDKKNSDLDAGLPERGTDGPILNNVKIKGKFPQIYKFVPDTKGIPNWLEKVPQRFLPYPGIIHAKTGFTLPAFPDGESSFLDNKKGGVQKNMKDAYDQKIFGYDAHDEKFSPPEKFYDKSSSLFVHLLDYYQGSLGEGFANGGSRIINPFYAERKSVKDARGATVSYDVPSIQDTTTITLPFFVQTSSDNEDPTMHGFEIKINRGAGLFNINNMEQFINVMSQYDEIGTRKSIYQKFINQFLKFFQDDSPVKRFDANIPNTIQQYITNPNSAKTHYIKSISGLDNLVSNSDPEKPKSFIDYDKDSITIDLNEDVTQNMGYLASLYKLLTWSRINGKDMIPQNLLRFDMQIEVTEIRKFQRLFNTNDYSLQSVGDLISKYRYQLYECQLHFPNLPHGDSLDMSTPKTSDGLKLKITYKFSTFDFIKLDPSGATSSTSKIKPEFFSNGSENPFYVTPPANFYQTGIRHSSNLTSDQLPTDDQIDNLKKSQIKEPSLLSQLGADLGNVAVGFLNRQIIDQARLLNKAIDEIRNAIPFAGRLDEPTNVYSGYDPAINQSINAVRRFVGGSINRFFKG